MKKLGTLLLMFSLIISVFDSVDMQTPSSSDDEQIVFGFLSYDFQEDEDDIDNSVIFSHFQVASNLVYTISPIFTGFSGRLTKEKHQLALDESYIKNLLIREDIKPPIS